MAYMHLGDMAQETTSPGIFQSIGDFFSGLFKVAEKAAPTAVEILKAAQKPETKIIVQPTPAPTPTVAGFTPTTLMLLAGGAILAIGLIARRK